MTSMPKRQQQSQKFPTLLRPFLGQVNNALFKDGLCRRQSRHHHLNHPPSNPPPLSCIEFGSYTWHLAQVSQNGSCHFAFKSLLMVSRTVGKQTLMQNAKNYFSIQIFAAWSVGQQGSKTLDCRTTLSQGKGLG